MSERGVVLPDHQAGQPMPWRIRRGQPIAWLILKDGTIVSARSVLPVREHGKLVTCLHAKAGFSGERAGRERRLAYSILIRWDSCFQ